jgi:Fur family ferric uptake transcriptional regulator
LKGHGADRTTVYRALSDLAEAGLLSRFDAGDHVWRFELAPASGAQARPAHAHFLCNDCGAIECLPEESLGLRQAARSPRSIVAEVSDVLLRGHCRDCH